MCALCQPDGMARRLAVVGGDAAGMGAASQAHRLDAGVEIVAFEKGDYTSYSACGIPYVIGGEGDGLDKLVVRTPPQQRDKSLLHLRLRPEDMQNDPPARRPPSRGHAHPR